PSRPAFSAANHHRTSPPKQAARLRWKERFVSPFRKGLNQSNPAKQRKKARNEPGNDENQRIPPNVDKSATAFQMRSISFVLVRCQPLELKVRRQGIVQAIKEGNRVRIASCCATVNGNRCPQPENLP